MKNMKNFIQFLNESKVEQDLDNSVEEFFSITENGMEKIEEAEEGDSDFLSIADMNMSDDMLKEDEEDTESDESSVKTGFGGEVYVSLDAPSLMTDKDQISEASRRTDTEDSETLKTLKSRHDDGDDTELDKIIDRNTNYILADDGYTLLVKDKESGERRPLTQDEIDVIVTRKNSENVYGNKSHFEFDDDGNLITVNNNDDSKRSILQQRYRTGFIKKLNDKVNDMGIHYKWVDGDSKDSSKMMINTTSWDDSDKRDGNRFDTAKYKELDSQDEKDAILKIVNKPKSDKKKDVIGFKEGKFTINDEPMNDEQLYSFVKVLNGQIGGTTKLLNPKEWGKKEEDYWNSYKISVAGSKVGNAINFNLPPVVTCHKNVLPCAKLCYAVKAYGAKPAVRGATDCNLALLKRDSGFELFKKSMIYALNTPTKGNGKKFNLCRIHVSGDFYSEDYFRAICDVARECSHVKFWMYTKQYEMLSSVGKGVIPENLCVIVSCWGDYNPINYLRKEGEKVGPYADLAKDFPLAYLDDGSEEFKKFNDEMQEFLGKPKDVQYCPCTTAEQIVTRCENCKICFDKSLANNNLVFKLH